MRTFIIAEAGVNHNGSLDLAKELVFQAAKAGADAVKFQTFKAENIVSKHAQKADYQKKSTSKDESQLEMVKRLEMNQAMHEELLHFCQDHHIKFLSTPFDLESVDLLASHLKVDQLKIPSGEITNGPLLLKAAQTKLPILLSTGMSTIGEVEDALRVLAYGYLGHSEQPYPSILEEVFSSHEGQKILKQNVKLLHCTTEYPAPFEDVNLRAMDTLEQAFGLPVGLSDHTEGIAVAIGAVARGATVIEKHFTLDKTLPGPDHKASLEPDELKLMITSIRQVELALGSSVKRATPSEQKNKPIARKSLVAACKIQKGELFSQMNLTTKRPGTGISPMHYWEWIGKPAAKDYEADEVIQQ
ncbi:N-acetylneuraminate synthase [Brevibacillus panacihumi]|uniref:N-acetylneuraminate synthase n=1 Tax=Brevibacillus panacihumi TaxID=497735 RepID=A0A3M8DB00_9BACL|nr:N-acetylneuraminate synthase [Brevibacillus panacihumi]RNB85222.1 N-acetylneuraminate synthase [Brevibacillus panacihumi]